MSDGEEVDMEEAQEMQEDEWELLSSMYEDDPALEVVVGADAPADTKSFKMTVTPADLEDYAEELQHSIVILFTLGPKYPFAAPVIDVELPENDFFAISGRQNLADSLAEEVESLLGMPMVMTLVDTVNMRFEEFVNTDTVKPKSLWAASTAAEEEEEAVVDDQAAEAEALRLRRLREAEAEEYDRKHMTKAQRRKMNDNINHKTGERPRGWNWTSVLSHLSRV
eukprot:TRINITY_DN6546_c0_g1_i1.p1 TRINITY_DN6546_c0_g1~~TRINITY_DN6546_c0_g1_i1.p1  ORF type:complete len:224 (+),score=66.14 TRINITY_DN6546_c0_g1_i1:18-689(+)